MVHPPATVRALWRVLDDESKVAVGLGLLAGLRASETFAADASWVHGDELHVPVRKTGEWNRTWLVETLRDILPATGPLVTASRNQVGHRLRKAAAKIGIDPPNIGPGAFRHHCASYAADAGYSTEQIRLVLSHQTGTMTDRYIHSQSIKTKREILTTVERVVFTDTHQ
jgi:integrase